MNMELYDRVPALIKQVRATMTAVVQASIETMPEEYTNGRDAWFKPFEEIRDDLKLIERKVRELREHE